MRGTPHRLRCRCYHRSLIGTDASGVYGPHARSVALFRYTAPPPASLSITPAEWSSLRSAASVSPRLRFQPSLAPAYTSLQAPTLSFSKAFGLVPAGCNLDWSVERTGAAARVHLSVWGGGHPYERIDIPLLWLHILRHTCSLLLEGGAIVSLDARHTGSAWARDAWRIRTVPAQRCAPPVTRGETREERVKMDARMVRAFGVTPTPAASTAVWMRTVPSRPPALPSRCPALSLARTLRPAAGNSSLDIFGRSRRLRKTYAGVGSAPSLTRAGQPVVSSRLPLSPVFSAEDQD
ncbi:hypothetical protein B0H13DRAFT_2307334 [Mycena leptocephala]|nr:hypothetical protein B0H13DRAFT_2307334 [Mycena leptocephala]